MHHTFKMVVVMSPVAVYTAVSVGCTPSMCSIICSPMRSSSWSEYIHTCFLLLKQFVYLLLLAEVLQRLTSLWLSMASVSLALIAGFLHVSDIVLYQLF